MIIVGIGVVFAMTRLPDPSRMSRHEIETRKGAAPTTSEHMKPTVGLGEPDRQPRGLLHFA